MPKGAVAFLNRAVRANSIPIVVTLMNPRANKNSHQNPLPGKGLPARSTESGPTNDEEVKPVPKPSRYEVVHR